MSTATPDNGGPRDRHSSSASLWGEVFGNRAFVACVLLMLGFAVTFRVLAKAMDIQFKKLPVPLKAPLDQLDQSQLFSPMFELDASLRADLHDGPVSERLRQAFADQKITLPAGMRVRVEESGRRWQIEAARDRAGASLRFVIRNTGRGLTVMRTYEVVQAMQLKPEILDSLGTDQYIEWYLVDRSDPAQSQQENAIQLFITYYTGTPDQVPHVPEECYVGGGFGVKNAEFLDLAIPALGPDTSVPIQVLEFGHPTFMTRGSKIVMYTFHTNGQFCAHRQCVRKVLGDPSTRHAYFSKLELSFGTSNALPEREEAIARGKRFLEMIIPILLEDHWPDWDKVIETANSKSKD